MKQWRGRNSYYILGRFTGRNRHLLLGVDGSDRKRPRNIYIHRHRLTTGSIRSWYSYCNEAQWQRSSLDELTRSLSLHSRSRQFNSGWLLSQE